MTVDSLIRARLFKRHRRCIHCRQPCVAGQKNAAGRPAHLSCQTATTIEEKR